jgi:hypothetical protein
VNIAINHLIGAVLVGSGATLFMDLWALILQRAFSVSPPNYCLVGRWLGHMPAGVFKHGNIAAASRKPAECAIGWIFHYIVGVSYALILVIPNSGGWLIRPTLIPALLLGVVTVLIPYFIMQPSFGLGIAAARTPKPNQARLRSLMSHTVFGVGLYASALALSPLMYPG